MKAISSFTKMQFLTLLVSIISLLFSPLVSFGQQTISIEDFSVYGDPSEIVFVDAIIKNTGDVPIHNAYYGIRVLSNSETTQVLAGAQPLGPQQSFAPGTETSLSTSFQPNSWIDGDHSLFLALVDAEGILLASQYVGTVTFSGTSPDIEILSDTCVIKKEDTQTTAVCDVSNNTNKELNTQQRVVVYTPSILSLNGESTSMQNNVTFAPNETQVVEFYIPTNLQESFAAKAGFGGEYTSNSFIVEHQKAHERNPSPEPNEPTVTPSEKGDIIFPGLVAMLALVILLSIMVYHRKQHKPLSETLPPIEGDNNEG